MKLYLQQVRKCLEIAVKCTDKDRRKRPIIGEIVRMLDETETLIRDARDLLDVYPTELCFPLRPKKHASCLLHLLNKDHDRVAFRLHSNSPKGYLTKLTLCGVVPPRCTYTLALTTSKQPLSDSDQAFVLQSISVGDQQERLLKDLNPSSASKGYSSLFENAKEVDRDEVQELTLKSVFAPVAEDAPSKVSSAKQNKVLPCLFTLCDICPCFHLPLRFFFLGLHRKLNQQGIEVTDRSLLPVHCCTCLLWQYILPLSTLSLPTSNRSERRMYIARANQEIKYRIVSLNCLVFVWIRL